jgi:hypothetical protein
MRPNLPDSRMSMISWCGEPMGIFLEGAAKAEGRTLDRGLRDMRRGAELLREQKVRTFDGLAKITLAEAEARAGDIDRALAILDETLATSERPPFARRWDGSEKADVPSPNCDVNRRDPLSGSTCSFCFSIGEVEGRATCSCSLSMRQNTPDFGGNREPANPRAIPVKSQTIVNIASQMAINIEVTRKAIKLAPFL